MKFIELKTPNGKPILINTNSIAYIFEEATGTTITFSSNIKDGKHVKETLEQIIKLLNQ